MEGGKGGKGEGRRGDRKWKGGEVEGRRREERRGHQL